MLIRNDCHGTTFLTTMSEDELEAFEMRIVLGDATDDDLAYAAWIRHVLCGVDDCTCVRNALARREPRPERRLAPTNRD